MAKIELPDFDDMFGIVQTIKALGMEKAVLDSSIKEEEAKVIKHVTITEAFFQNGKPPSMSFVEKTYAYTGLNNELVDKRRRLAEITYEIESYRNLLDFYKIKIEVWRTLSANERAATT